jgi:uncharacterized phiE125 gp8 family phage protein
MSAVTSDPIVSPVSDADLALWLGVDDDDPVLPSLLLSATQSVINRLGLDLINRDWTLTLWDWPKSGAQTHPNLSRPPLSYNTDINLPYANLRSVESVAIYGQETIGYIARERSIILVGVVPSDAYKQNSQPAIVVEYVAGFGDDADAVPDSIKQAIKMLAAFDYEHRGSCDAGDAMAKSGAEQLLRPFRRPDYVVLF